MKPLKIKIENMESPNGNPVPNQFIIYAGNCVYFQSYKTIIACIEKNGIEEKVYLDEHYWNYSKTTGKYRNIFLGENKKETEQKIKSGEYVLTNLN